VALLFKVMPGKPAMKLPGRYVAPQETQEEKNEMMVAPPVNQGYSKKE